MLKHPGHACALATTPGESELLSRRRNWTLFSSSRTRSTGMSPESLNTHAAEDRSSPRPEGRGKQQEPLEVGGKRILLGLFSRFLSVSARARGCWGLLWPQHSSGSVRCWGAPGSEPGLPAAPIEAEAVGTGSTLQPTARQETPQGGAGAQVAAAAKVKALSAWPAPGAPGHLDGATGESISVAPNAKFQAFLGVFLGSPDSTCLCAWAPFPLGSGAFLDIWRKRVTRPRPGQLPFRSPREWAGAGPEGRGTFWKVGTGCRFSAERARSNLGEGQWARRKRQASEQSPGEREREGGWNGRCKKAALPYPPPPGHQQYA